MNKYNIISNNNFLNVNIFLYAIIWVLWSSCFPYENKKELEFALRLAGENRSQLEVVLDYYRHEPQKCAAACFLIENMPRYFSYTGEPIERTKRALLFMKQDNDNMLDKLIHAANRFSYSDLDRVYDLEVITADYLIKHIDRMFKHWQERPWNKNLSFDEFCEYLLPYRIGFEPLEDWHEAYENKYGPVLDSLYFGTDVIEAASQLNMYIGKTEKIVFNSELTYLNPGPLFYLDCKTGSCIDHKNSSIYILRSVGIPAMGDFYRNSPSGAIGMHTWAVVRDTTGKDVSFRSPGLKVERGLEVEHTKGKVYREYYGKQKLSPELINDPDVPAFFRLPYIKDVTDNYTGINRMEVEVPEKHNENVYLGVHTSWRTTPIAVAKARKGKAVFENVEEGVVYQLFSAKGGTLYPAGYPVLYELDSIHNFVPDTNRLQTVTLYRKYFMADWLYTFMNYMIGGRLEGAMDKNFTRKTFSYQVQDSVKNIIVKSFNPDTLLQTRFVRFMSSLDSWVNLAEVSFYTSQGQIPSGRISLSGGPSLNVYKNGALQNITDGDPLTYYSSAYVAASAVFDLGSPVSLSRIDIMPRTDDNFIRIGDLYELHYHAGVQGWKSLGKQQADQLFLQYNVPSNALLWLQNHTRGKEEQVFFMKEGEQVFTGRIESNL